MTETPETLRELRYLHTGDLRQDVLLAHAAAWAADKARIEALVEAFGYRGYALDGFCKWVCQSCKAELITTDAEGPEAMEHKAGCIVAELP